MFPPLYAILDPSRTQIPLTELAVQLADAGVSLMQLRSKQASAARMFDQASELAVALAQREVRFIVNDRPDIAALVKSGGVHVGQDDLPVGDARKLCPSPLWVGVSTHNLAQFEQALATSADYIAVGPIFPTATKENPDPVVGLDLLRAVRPLTRKPIVAIGGITLAQVGQVYEAGADSVAVIQDLIVAPDPAERAREYLKIARETLGSGR